MKRTQCSRWVRPLLCLLVAMCVTACLLPLKADAAGSKGPMLCLSTSDGENYETISVGIPIDLGEEGVVLTSTDLYVNDNLVYVGVNEAGQTCSLTYQGDMYGLSVYLADDADMTAFYSATSAPVEGGRYTLRGINSEPKFAQITVTVTGVTTTESSQGGYTITIEGDDSNIASPAVIVDGDRIVAIRNGSRTFALDQPVPASGGSGGSDDSGGSGGSDDSGGSGGSDDSGGSGGSGDSGYSGGSGGQKRGEPSKKENRFLVPVLCGGGVVILIIVLVLVIGLRKKPNPVPPMPPTPYPPAPRPDINLETKPVEPEPTPIPPIPPIPPAPEPRPVMLYLQIEDGPMAGQQYSIPDGGSLLIGRSAEANIRYPADTKGVSRKHCQVYWSKGSLQVMDLGSTAGTFLRGKGQLTPNVPVALTEGSTLYLGSKSISIRLRSRQV